MGEQDAQSMSSLYLSQDSSVRFKKRKANFSFSEVHILLDEVRKNRHIVVGKFNSGIPSEVKRRKWAEITERVNEIGECDREVSEVIKKWSDLKCDTKRKLAALRSGNVPPFAPLSQGDLSPTESIIQSILELDRKNWDARSRSRSRSGEMDVLMGDDDDDDDESAFLGVGSVHSSPGETRTMAPPGGSSGADGQGDTPGAADTDSRLMDSDNDQQDVFPSSSLSSVNNSLAEDDGTHNTNANANATHISSTNNNNANVSQPPPPSAPEPDAVREQLAQSASLSLQEQHTTNALLGTVSRSLELLAESVQQLAETQQEFVRESLQLQRETVQVLREFAAGALTLLHEKVNGKPPLF